MITYKLFRMKNGKLYPLFVDVRTEIPVGEWVWAIIGKLADPTHVRSKIGPLALRPGFHSTEVPFTDWIGTAKGDGELRQRADTVWAECEVEGKQEEAWNGKRTLPADWYYFKARNPVFKWIVSNRIRVNRILDHSEVVEICREHGLEAQKMEDE